MFVFRKHPNKLKKIETMNKSKTRKGDLKVRPKYAIQ